MKKITFLAMALMNLIAVFNCFGAEEMQESAQLSTTSGSTTADVATHNFDQKKIDLGVFLNLLQKAKQEGTRESMQIVVNYAQAWRKQLEQSVDPRDLQLHDELGMIIATYEKALQEVDEAASEIAPSLMQQHAFAAIAHNPSETLESNYSSVTITPEQRRKDKMREFRELLQRAKQTQDTEDKKVVIMYGLDWIEELSKSDDDDDLALSLRLCALFGYATQERESTKENA